MMDHPKETKIVPSFEEVETQTALLAQRVETVDKTNVPELRVLVREAKTLDWQLHASLRPMSIEQVNARYPNRGDAFHSLTTSLIAAAEAIPFGQRFSEDWKYYVEALLNNAGEYFHKESGGYYNLGWPAVYFEIPEESKLLEKIGTDPTSVLTLPQEEKIYRFEEGTFKIHLNTSSPETRLAALKKFLGVLKADNDIVHEIFKEKNDAENSRWPLTKISKHAAVVWQKSISGKSKSSSSRLKAIGRTSCFTLGRRRIKLRSRHSR